MPSEEFKRVQRALREAGLPADDFGRFVNPRKLEEHSDILGPPPVFDYEHSVPVLLDVLASLTEFDALETTVRRLKTAHAKPAAAVPLMALFERLPTSENRTTVKWTIGDTLGRVTMTEHRDRLLRLCLDERHGPDRQMIVSRVGWFKNDSRVSEALIRLLNDEDVALHAMGALRTQIGAERAREYVQARLEDPSAQIRDQAARELRKIDKAIAKKSSSPARPIAPN